MTDKLNGKILETPPKDLSEALLVWEGPCMLHTCLRRWLPTISVAVDHKYPISLSLWFSFFISSLRYSPRDRRLI